MTNNQWQFLDTAVVILAQSHNPSVINHDFLKNHGIVGKDWNLSGLPITTPIATQIRYEKNIGWQVTPDTCIIAEKIGTKAHNSLSLYECAKKYVEILQYIPYTALGINWKVSHVLNMDPKAWLKFKFLKNGSLIKKILTAELAFKLESVDSSICSLVVTTTSEQNKNIVLLNCNFHFNVQEERDKSKKISEVLEKSIRYKETLEGYLNEYIIKEGDII